MKKLEILIEKIKIIYTIFNLLLKITKSWNF